MSEEQPVFKVTDRRLFNADGSPRESGMKEEQSSNDNSSSVVEPSFPGGNQSSASTVEAAPESQPQAASAAAVGRAESSTPDALPSSATDQFDEDFGEGEMGVPYDDDPASFTNFLMSLASNAAASLGLMEHPATGLRAVDLPLAKHWIDTLGMLQQKTRGNLTPQEQQIMEGLLADMRMQFVALTTGGGPGGPSPRGGARKFSGSDITGGR